MADVNRQWLLTERPSGIVGPENFEWREEPVPEVGEGEFLVRNQWISCDPAQRSWMEIDTYIPKLPLGEVMQSGSAGEVVESNHPEYAKGDLVSGAFGWQDYAVSDGKRSLFPVNKIPPGVDLPTALSLFGITGLTAYFGLFEVGEMKEDDTVLVSGAAGAVGSIALQVAKASGCRAVGIAGGERKCAWLRDELGADAAVDYKQGGLSAALHEACPDGVNVFFDNVGGEVLDAALANLAPRGRVVLCGAIAGYNSLNEPPPVHNHANLIVVRGRMQGFLIFDYAAKIPEAIGALAGWAGEGKIKNQVDVVEGLENTPDAFRRLFTGENLGKQLVKVAE